MEVNDVDSSSEEGDVVIDLEDSSLNLSFEEAFFLAFGLGCLLVTNSNGEEQSLDQLWSFFCRNQPDFPRKYAVYHHFRTKGFVVKEGTKFGSDFLLYKDGPPFFHAQYSVRIVEKITWKEMSGLNRVTESAGKELLLVQINQKESEENSNVKEILKNMQIEEILIRRWVANLERESS